jgi:putative ABC transport system permease protein
MRPPPPPVYRRTLLERIGLQLLPDQPTRMILRHVVRWPLRSAMTVLGIAIATAILLGPMAVLDSAKHMVDVHFFRSDRQDLTVAFAQVRPEAAAMHAMTHAPGVLQVEPFRATLANISYGGKQRRITVLARHPVNALARPLLNHFDPLDIPTHGIVVSSTMASWLGAGPGDFLDVQFLESRRPRARLPIVAVAQAHVGLTFFMLHMDIKALNRLMGDSDVITGVNMRLDPTSVNALYSELKDIPSITGVVSHTTQLEAMHRIMAQTTRMTMMNIIFAAIIVFGVVYNSARISLSERSRELATMRMLGFTRIEVSYILLGELALLTAMAIPIGCGLGYALAWKLTEGTTNEMFRLPLWVLRNSYGYTIMIAVATVAISSAVVMWRIFRLDSIGILKTRE